MSNFPALLFDLDGTLIDTAPDLTAAANHAFTSVGLKPVNLERIKAATGQGALAMLEQGLSEMAETKGHTADELLPVFLEYYTAHIADKSRVFEGLTPLLEECLALNVPMAVVTNKREDLARQLITTLKLDYLFPVIIGGDTLPVRKPAPDMLYKAMADLAVDKAIMIGDSYADRGAAEAANIPFIGVGFGYGPWDVSVDALPMFVDQPQDLRSQVEACAGPLSPSV